MFLSESLSELNCTGCTFIIFPHFFFIIWLKDWISALANESIALIAVHVSILFDFKWLFVYF